MKPAGTSLLATFLLTAVACQLGGASPPDAEDRVGAAPRALSLGAFERMACGLPEPILLRTWNGYFPERSGDIQIIPKAPATFGVSHSGPWDYLQRVPMFFYGPGHVPARGAVDRPATMADVAPTLARHLGFDFRAPDGRPLPEAIEGARPPRLVVVVVWDGGGRNLLSEYPDAWPNLRRLIPRGVWFERATLGSSPSVTPSIHTTLGTGAFPRHHGVVDFVMRIDGRLVDVYESGPQELLVPSLGDLWDRANDNVPVVGMVAYKNWHLGMLGHGSSLKGGDRDVAVVVDEERGRWALNPINQRFFQFPEYVNDVSGLEEGRRLADLADGRRDGRYFSKEDLGDPTFVWRTPAFTHWQTRVLEEMIRREGFGADDVPDILFTNYKQIDQAGHLWTMNSVQMEQALRASDATLPELLDALDRTVGSGQWVLALTADHGVTPNPFVTGAFGISKEELVRDIEAAFAGTGDPGGVVQRFGRTHLWINRETLEDRGYTLEEVASFVARYTKGENAQDPAKLSNRQRSGRVFSAAFPSEVLENLPCGARIHDRS